MGSSGFKIGICWQGVVGPFNVGREFPLAQFAGISKVLGVRLISLHKGAARSQLEAAPEHLRVEDLGDSFDAGPQVFLDTAAAMKHCDLVITSDTSIAQLAGALAVPTWVVLKQVPEWRWQLHRLASPWYPTMRLFRQTARGAWSGPFADVERELRRLAGAPVFGAGA